MSTQWPRFNLAAGPVDVLPRTLADLSKPVLYHYDPAFKELFAHSCDLLKQVFRTDYDVIIMQGEAILGLEAAAASLISPGDKVLNLVSGVFGKWFELFIDHFGGETIELAVPYNDAIDPETVRRIAESQIPASNTARWSTRKRHPARITRSRRSATSAMSSAC